MHRLREFDVQLPLPASVTERLRWQLMALLLLLALCAGVEAANGTRGAAQSAVFERTFESKKAYADPFNDVDVDVIFTKGDASWRMPAFWRGGNNWTVRFAAPSPGEYSYRLESTDRSNADLNGRDARVTLAPYRGSNDVLRRGMLRTSDNKRYFEHADGTPFYWLGDIWVTGLSSRLSWSGFQELLADRKKKGFTVIQVIAGLVPYEEKAPLDPGFTNEGGSVWDADYKRINPKFFDYADRRIRLILDEGLLPVIVGAWGNNITELGVEKMKKHWRYVIARYGAYPVLWIAGGEVYDPPKGTPKNDILKWVPFIATPGWSDVVRYIRSVDPYRHPVTVEDWPFQGLHPILDDESLMDFDFPQLGHDGWPTIAYEVGQLNAYYSRTEVTKPFIVGEIGFENLAEQHLADFQRVAFWLGMLNGAAGRNYGANGVWEHYHADAPFQRAKWSLLSWQEGMNLPGSYQVGIGAKLLRQYEWWRFQPRPEWVTPRGTTLLEPRSGTSEFDARAEWEEKKGNFLLPYAAGIPGEVRFVYFPCFGMTCMSNPAPTVLKLETGVRYKAYYWEPSLGIKVDLGAVERPAPAATILNARFDSGEASTWKDHSATSTIADGKLSAKGDTLTVANGITEADLVVSVDIHRDANAGIVLRYRDANNHVTAFYSSTQKAITIIDRIDGVETEVGHTPVTLGDSALQLSAEVRGKVAAVSITDGRQTVTSPIVNVRNTAAGGVGLMHEGDGTTQAFKNLELRKSPALVTDTYLEKKLYDARGTYRGEMKGGGAMFIDSTGITTWDNYGKVKNILLDAYRPERLPTSGDWLLVLETPNANKHKE